MPPISHQSLHFDLPGLSLPGDLALPEPIRGLVVFAHGSGSSRFSTRNRAVAAALQQRHFGTLLFDLLTEDEDRVYQNRFDINLLTQRLCEVTRLLRQRQIIPDGVPVAYFGASTGAAASLRAAAELGSQIAAVVSRGGRPDLAEAALPRVLAPTLLIVGAWDDDVLQLNRRAYARLGTTKELAVVPGATHLFEEPGTLETVAHLAGDWFARHCKREIVAIA